MTLSGTVFLVIYMFTPNNNRKKEVIIPLAVFIIAEGLLMPLTWYFFAG